MKIDQQTIEKYKIAQQQSLDLAISWIRCAEDTEEYTEEWAIYSSMSDIFANLAGDYEDLIENIERYNRYNEKQEEERTYQWTNRETMAK